MNRVVAPFFRMSYRARESAERKTSVPDQWSQTAVVWFACFVALLVVLLAFFTNRNGDVDELAMYNPAYMLAHYGKLTFPSYPHQSVFNDPVIVHPPVHLGLIGLLCRLGFTWYYAEAVPTAALFLACIVVIVRGLFPVPVKLGLLFSIGFTMLIGETGGLTFGTRPEGALQAAWFLGLLLLESGRLDDWDRGKLFAGAFALTWASTMHYYAAVAFTGVAVYWVWAVRTLGWKAAKPRLVALCAGGCLFGIPYVAFYLIPYFKQISTTIQTVQGTGGVLVSLRTHFQLYRYLCDLGELPVVLRKSVGLQIPLVIFSTAVLSCIRSTRGIALAALPLQLFVLIFASHKWNSYLLHEIALFMAAMAVGGLMLCDYLLGRLHVQHLQRVLAPAASLALCVYLVTNNPNLSAAIVSTEPHVHEADLARAASRIILGPHATVVGRFGAWYSGGAAYWWDLESDMFGRRPYPPAKYFSNFDAVVDYPHLNEIPLHDTVGSWYAKGLLKLRGFYFGETNEELQFVLLSARPVSQVVGYASRNGQVYRFEERPIGDYQVISAVCPHSPQLEYSNWINRWPGTFSSLMQLPKPTADADVVVNVLTAQSPEPAGWIGRSCKEITKLNGALLLVDRRDLVDSLRRQDKPIQFPRSLGQIPGFIGVGLPDVMTPPQDSVRLNDVLSLADLRPTSDRIKLERNPAIRLTTPLSGGAFAASIQLRHRELIVTRCWVMLRLKVTAGEIGFGAFNNRSGDLTRTPFPVLKSEEPQDAVLEVPAIRNATHVVVFNDGSLPGQFELLDATILVTRQDGEHLKETLAVVR
jgi:hypothetical protein